MQISHRVSLDFFVRDLHFKTGLCRFCGRATDGVQSKIRGPLVKWPKTPASHAGNSGSNPLRVTIFKNNGTLNMYAKRENAKHKVGINDHEGPPVPIPNTEVKLMSVESTWVATPWEDRSMPTFFYKKSRKRFII